MERYIVAGVGTPTPVNREGSRGRSTDPGHDFLLPMSCAIQGGTGPAKVFDTLSRFPAASNSTLPMKAFRRSTVHDQPLAVFVAITSFKATGPGLTLPRPNSDSTAAAARRA